MNEERNLTILKFGSDTVLESRKSVDEMKQKISSLLYDVLYDGFNTDIVIVSSGAVKFGRKITGKNLKYTQAACTGQYQLMRFWDDIISPYINGSVGQVLVDYNTQKDKNHFETINNLIQENIIPIVNFNDADSNEELKELSKYKDNDETHKYIIELMARFSNYKNIYSVTYSTTPFLKKTPEGNILVPEIDPDTTSLEALKAHLDSGKSKGGTGGMESKIEKILELVLRELVYTGVISDTSNTVAEILNCVQNHQNTENATFIRKKAA